MKFKAEIMVLDASKNRNGRIYTHKCAEEILATYKDHNKIYLGYLEDVDNESKYLDRVCGKVTNVYMERTYIGDTLYAEGEIFENTQGYKIYNELKEIGLDMYLTITGFGTLVEMGTVTDYEFKYFDLVTDDAFNVNSIKEVE